MNRDCRLEARKELEIQKKKKKNHLRILCLHVHAPHQKKGRVSENENYYHHTVGKHSLKGLAVPAQHLWLSCWKKEKESRSH